MKKLKKLLSYAAAATLAVTSLVGGATLSANAADGDLITDLGPLSGINAETGEPEVTFIANYPRQTYFQQSAFQIEFKYDTVGTPANPQPGEPDVGYNDTFEFLVYDSSWNGWNRTTVGPAGVDQTSTMTPEENTTYTVTVPIDVIESKLSTGQEPYGINLQTGAQLGTSRVTIVALRFLSGTYVQPEFTVDGSWVMGATDNKAMTVDPAGAATVNSTNQYYIEISAIDLSNWVNPTVDVTVTYDSASSDTDNDGNINYSQAEIGIPTGKTDPETGEEIYESPDPNYVLHDAGTYTYTTEIPNTTSRFIAAYQDCTVSQIKVYDNTAGNEDYKTVTGQTATTISKDMGLAWNLGNALDTVDEKGNANEKAINPKTTKKLIQAVKAAGFNTIKIPVSFMNLVGEDGKIDDVYMARIQRVVDYAYDMGMYSIVSLHSDGMPTVPGYWINIDKTGEEFDQIVDKYSALWSNVARAFTGYDQKVLFQAGNEFNNSTGNYAPPTQIETDNVNTLDQAFVNAVRNAGGENNADRVLSVVGYLNDIDYTIAGFAKPTDTATDRLILCVNYYTPQDFTLGGFEGGIDSSTTWDMNATYGGKAYMENQLIKIRDFASGLGMPAMIGEYAPVDKNNTQQRVNYDYLLNYYAAKYGIVTAYWDNGETGYLGTALFDRTNNVITPTGQTLVDAIFDGYKLVVNTNKYPNPTNSTSPTNP